MAGRIGGSLLARPRARLTGSVLAMMAAWAGWAAEPADWLPASCKAVETVGMHDYPGAEERYHASVFFEGAFELRENLLFMEHLLGQDGAPVGLYVTLSVEDGGETEFECRPVRGGAGNEGFSCVNNPPSEMLLVNPVRGRFTRAAIGGWTFYGAREEQEGASLFVEYGQCVPMASGEGPSTAPP